MIQQPELFAIMLNLMVMCIGYFLVYPKYCGSNINKIALNDLMATCIPLTIVGSVFWESGTEFSLLFFSTNWFWFTLLTYITLEIPLAIYYFKKYKVLDSLDFMDD